MKNQHLAEISTIIVCAKVFIYTMTSDCPFFLFIPCGRWSEVTIVTGWDSLVGLEGDDLLGQARGNEEGIVKARYAAHHSLHCPSCHSRTAMAASWNEWESTGWM